MIEKKTETQTQGESHEVAQFCSFQYRGVGGLWWVPV